MLTNKLFLKCCETEFLKLDERLFIKFFESLPVKKIPDTKFCLKNIKNYKKK